MPGISLIFSRNAEIRNISGNIRSALGALVHDDSYSSSSSMIGEHLFLGYTSHKKYTVSEIEDQRYYIFVDGFVYNRDRSDLESSLLSVARRMPDCSEDAARWISDTDGEYGVFISDRKTGDTVIFNDPLSRISFYYLIDEKGLMVSREPRFINSMRGETVFDRNSIFEYLLFGYPLEGRTVFKGINRLRGGSMIKFNTGAGQIEIENIHSFNYEEKENSGGSLHEHAGNMADLLETACRRRSSPPGINVVSLSGGLDSRSVSTCLANQNIPFSTATFLDAYGIVGPDVAYAEKIAQTLEAEWNMFRLHRAEGSVLLDLLNRLSGLNYLGVGHILELLERIGETYGEGFTLFTGDGGDRVIRDTRPVGNISSLEGLVGYILDFNTMLSIEMISDIVGKPGEEIRSRLRDMLSGYQERDYKMKYLQFIFSERCPGWHFQGEERSRFYTRTMTPFYGSEVFRYSMNLPDRWKKNYRLYREILLRLSPDIAAINNSEWKFPITSWKLPFYGIARRVYFGLPEPLRKIVEYRLRWSRVKGAYTPESPVWKCLERQLSGPVLSDYLDVDKLRAGLTSMEKMGFDHLFTITSLIEKETAGRSSISDFISEEMI